MNEHEAERIAAALNQLRPDWPRRSLLTLIEKSLMDRPRRDVAVALTWVACEKGTATPARVLEAGPWWRAAAIEGQAQTREPYDRDSFCDICGKPAGRHPDADHAFVSVTDQTRRLAADEDRERRKGDALDYAREAVAEAKATPADPPHEPERKPSPNVDALRAHLTTPDRDRERGDLSETEESAHE